MSHITLLFAALVAAQQPQSGKKEEKPKPPPFTVVIVARTARFQDEMQRQAFESSLKQLKTCAELISRNPMRDADFNEEWTFEVAGEKKFDPAPFWNTFISYKVKTCKLTLTGTLSQEAQTKKLFITTFSGKTKVKLMNRPKGQFDDPDKKIEDNVGKLTEKFDEGKLHWEVTGEIFSHGGALAILL